MPVANQNVRAGEAWVQNTVDLKDSNRASLGDLSTAALGRATGIPRTSSLGNRGDLSNLSTLGRQNKRQHRRMGSGDFDTRGFYSHAHAATTENLPDNRQLPAYHSQRRYTTSTLCMALVAASRVKACF